MSLRDAVSIIYWTRIEGIAYSRSVQFVTPAISTLLAAETINRQNVKDRINFTSDASVYAEIIGLLEILNGNTAYVPEKRSGLQGKTYSQLTRLAMQDDVNSANKIINDVLFKQLEGFNKSIVHQITKVVGELHDNVVSHASGAGFSSVQVYENSDKKRIVFAIADAGRGLLWNIRRTGVDPSVSSHSDAIKWCLKRGNSTAKTTDDWAQSIPDDFFGISPFPGEVSIRSDGSHHMGEGLWLLDELVKRTGGELWILTGDSEYHSNGPKESMDNGRINWNGVVIVLEISISRFQGEVDCQKENFDQLAQELGL